MEAPVPGKMFNARVAGKEVSMPERKVWIPVAMTPEPPELADGEEPPLDERAKVDLPLPAAPHALPRMCRWQLCLVQRYTLLCRLLLLDRRLLFLGDPLLGGRALPEVGRSWGPAPANTSAAPGTGRTVREEERGYSGGRSLGAGSLGEGAGS